MPPTYEMAEIVTLHVSSSEVVPNHKVFTVILSEEVFQTSSHSLYEIRLGVQGELVHASMYMLQDVIMSFS